MVELKKCPKCGNTVEPNWKLCPNCLQKLEISDSKTKRKSESSTIVKDDKSTLNIFENTKYKAIIAFLFLFIIAVALSNVTIARSTTETYTEKEPYNVTEIYTENEPYTVKEPYQDTEIYYEKEACGTTTGTTGTYYTDTDGSKILRIGTGTVTKYCDVPKTRTVTNYKDVIKYRDVNKTRTVTKYKDVEKTRTVTKKVKILDILLGKV